MSTFGIRIALFVGGIASLVVSVGLFATQVENKPYGVHDLQRDKWDKIQSEIRQRQQTIADAAKGERALPVVNIAEGRFEFGMQPPFCTLSHKFRISNDGSADLQLTFKKSSSQAVKVELPSRPIAAGESAEVLVRWDVGEASGPVQKSITIGTNDPFRHTVTLTVNGRIPVILGMSDSKFSAPRVEPDQLVEASTVIYSQTWDDFEISGVACDLESFQWSAQPLSDTECSEQGYLAAYRLTLSVSRNAKGTFEEPVKISIQPPENGWRPDTDAATSSSVWFTALQNEQALVLDTSFHGRVISKIGFYGQDLDVNQGLDMGHTTCGTRKEFPLLVRYRGRRLPDRLAVLDIQPSQLEARIEAVASRPGTYRLVVSVPEDASQVVFNTDQQHGFVQVGDPDHSEINNWFPVMGAILKAPQQRGTGN